MCIEKTGIEKGDGLRLQEDGSPLLLDAAKCLDDCLVLLMPEEFSVEDFIKVQHRMQAGGGRLNRIATTADALRDMEMK